MDLSAGPPDDTVEIGGRYRLVRELGRGGMGRVWEALDGELRRPVAVKELLLPDDLEPAERRRLMTRTVREARAAALLEHESIVAVHDVLVDGGRPWIVMELIDGITLREAAPVPPAEVVPTVAPRAGTPTPEPAPTFPRMPTLDPSRLLSPPGFTPSLPPCVLRGEC
ncbi:protein kinase [Actinomadura sp. 9N215]|uniref:protein kinase domain-containing protein n=1 Tax=Actinomadura sp. 9N215 TaxID=3375150 RepID=UPI0037980A91